ncbi:Uncharacterised protein [Mycobacteroides abscessus]|nr:Uncharacterised protein [Mycobacteroides abscessus]
MSASGAQRVSANAAFLKTAPMTPIPRAWLLAVKTTAAPGPVSRRYRSRFGSSNVPQNLAVPSGWSFRSASRCSGVRYDACSSAVKSTGLPRVLIQLILPRPAPPEGWMRTAVTGHSCVSRSRSYFSFDPRARCSG